MEIPWLVAGQAGEGADAVVMASRFELKSAWRSPLFLMHSLRLWRQALRSPGALGVSLRAAPFRGVFWTLSAWTDRPALAAYARTNPHDVTMGRIRPWMKDSVFRFWTVPAADLPAARAAAALWAQAEERVLASSGPRGGAVEEASDHGGA